ncbi:MAG: hypothetical protein OM95_15880 [Bdellovibrio sp. ArHS]|nr:MAG: hypothetical protein OM95_15880 [Bdellovibrio sp. ArHS]
MEKSCEDVSNILKSMAHPQRLMVLGHLLAGEKTVSELVGLCEISQSQMSHFLTRLSLEGLVKCEKEGRYRVYSIADKRLKKLIEVIQKEYCGD